MTTIAVEVGKKEFYKNNISAKQQETNQVTKGEYLQAAFGATDQGATECPVLMGTARHCSPFPNLQFSTESTLLSQHIVLLGLPVRCTSSDLVNQASFKSIVHK